MNRGWCHNIVENNPRQSDQHMDFKTIEPKVFNGIIPNISDIIEILGAMIGNRLAKCQWKTVHNHNSIWRDFPTQGLSNELNQPNQLFCSSIKAASF